MEEDRLDKDGLEAAAAVLVGAMGVAEEGMMIFDTGADGGFTDATLRMESASEAL